MWYRTKWDCGFYCERTHSSTNEDEYAVAPDQNGNTDCELTINDMMFNDLFDIILPPSINKNNFERMERDCILESNDISTDSEDLYGMETQWI